jgi:P27 family predicted phage terminase small subunit
MANPKKPTHLKAIQGTLRKDRDNPAEPKANPGVASCPDWLSARAAELFSQLTATLLGMGIASPDDQAALAMLASRLEEVELMTAAIEDGGRVYEQTDETGAVRMVRARPEVAMRNEAMRHAQSLLGEFGLTPAARSKVSAGKPAETNPFKAFG